MTKQEYECFQLYTAINQHFAGKFDFFKYDGKIKVKPSTYEGRKDRYFFQKLSKQYSRQELINFFVGNIIHDKKIYGGNWIGNLLNDEAHSSYLKYKGIIESLSYHFENDCKKLIDYQEKYRIKFIQFFHLSESMCWPHIFYTDINPESLVILNEVIRISLKFYKPFEYISLLNNEISPVWDAEERPFLERFTPFLKFDKVKMKSIIDKYFTGDLS